jgi:hypothetical protein
MKIVNIYGGLGNALFQICWALYLKKKGCVVKIDTLGLERNYREKLMFFLAAGGVELEECSYWERVRVAGIISRKRVKGKEIKILSHIFRGRVYAENSWGDIPGEDYSYYFGYFQNYKLASDCVEIFDNCLNNIAKKYSFSKQTEPAKCFVHIRRGDYCSTAALCTHGVLGKDYYEAAMKEFNVISFDAFTNDPAWVRDNVKSAILKEMDYNGFAYSDIYELYMMSRYHNGIIANSTFSFWAALLGCKNKKIVCPSKWFADENLQHFSYKIKNRNWTQR